MDPGGAGDVTDTHVRWMVRRGVSHLPSFIVDNGLILMVSDQSGLANCLDVKTGKQVWQERLRAGREHWASPIVADGKVYFSSKTGEIAVVAAAREFELLAKNRIDGTINASPAVAGDSLIVRSDTHLYRIAEGYETASQEKKPDDMREEVVVKKRTSGGNSLLAANGYFLGGKTNEDGKFEASFIMETDGDKAHWPTVTLTGEQFRSLCEGLEKYHRVALNLATGKVVTTPKNKGEGNASKKGRGNEARKDKAPKREKARPRDKKDSECRNSDHEGYRTIVQYSETREYILHVPASYDSDRPTPLVINFHGFGACASGYLKNIGDFHKFNSTADTNSADSHSLMSFWWRVLAKDRTTGYEKQHEWPPKPNED